MKEVRFIGDFNLKKDQIRITDENIYHHGVNVLRLNEGDSFIISDGKGREADSKVLEMDNRSMTVSVENVRENKNEPDKEVVLYCSIIKRGNFEDVCRHATEIGVKKIVPIISERTVKTGLKRDRLEKIIREAAEQSRRGFVPLLSSTITFEKALDEAVSSSNNVLMPHTGVDKHIKDIDLKTKKEIAIFIGPEGGWSEEEIEKAKKKEVNIVSLGKTTLKAETAAIVGSYYVVNT